MAISSKDIETLWNRYSEEGCKNGASVAQNFESNGVPYRTFESSEKGGEVAAAWLTFIETCKLQKKVALDFFNSFFRMVTEGRSDYELIAQEALS